MTLEFVIALSLVWATHAAFVPLIMVRRGAHPLSWFVLTAVMGPAVWPLVLAEVWSRPWPPVIVAPGRYQDGAASIVAFFERDELPEPLAALLAGLSGKGERVTLVRVVKAGAPVYMEAAARRFLNTTARERGLDHAELWICFGTMSGAVRQMRAGSDVVLRSDRDVPGDAYAYQTKCLRDVRAA